MFESTDGWKNCRVKIDRIRRASPHAEHIKSHYEAVSQRNAGFHDSSLELRVLHANFRLAALYKRYDR